MRYFISGHLDLSQEEFDTHYLPQIINVLNDPDARFVIGDAMTKDSKRLSCDQEAQNYLVKNGYGDRITIYHMMDKPRFLLNSDIKTIGGFQSDDERDSQMTEDSDQDIAWVRPQEECKRLYGKKYKEGRLFGTEKNLRRRNTGTK